MKKITVKLLKGIKQTSSNTTYSNAIKFRFAIQFSSKMAEARAL